MTLVWESEHNFRVSMLTLYIVGRGYRIHVIRIGGKYLSEPFHQPQKVFSIIMTGVGKLMAQLPSLPGGSPLWSPQAEGTVDSTRCPQPGGRRATAFPVSINLTRQLSTAGCWISGSWKL